MISAGSRVRVIPLFMRLLRIRSPNKFALTPSDAAAYQIDAIDDTV